jgi:multidrug efflux system membrane fusion protein
MYAYFDVDEPTVQQVQDLIRAGKFEQKKDRSVHWPVYLGLAAEKGYPHEGYVDFSNNEVSAGTATLQVRGVFANPKPTIGPRVLAPGQFVRIRVPVSPRYQALLVVEDAIQTDQSLKFLYVVDDQSKVARRDVKLGSPHEGLRVIKEGLKPEEHVVVNGLQHIKAGVEVQAKLVPMPVPSPSPAAQIAPP